MNIKTPKYPKKCPKMSQNAHKQPKICYLLFKLYAFSAPKDTAADKITVSNIDWSWDKESLSDIIGHKGFNAMLTLAKKNLANPVNITNEDDLVDELYDQLRHGKLSADEVFDLPDTVEIEVKDGAVWTEEDITNYLCDKYGYLINGYALDTDVA